MWRIVIKDSNLPSIYLGLSGCYTEARFNARLFDAQQKDATQLPDRGEWEWVS